jgi:hypothetical protein
MIVDHDITPASRQAASYLVSFVMVITRVIA